VCICVCICVCVIVVALVIHPVALAVCVCVCVESFQTLIVRIVDITVRFVRSRLVEGMH